MLKSKFLRALTKGLLFPMCFMLGVPDGGTGGEGNPAESANNNDGQGSGDGNPAAGEGTKTFTQEDLNRIGAREKAEGRRALLKELGIEDTEDARQAVQNFLKQQESQKTEAQKAAERAAKAEKEKADAEAKASESQQKLEALMAKANPDTLDDLIVLTRAKVNDKTDFKAALGIVKAAYPAFFADAQANEGTQKKPVGTGGSTNPPKGAANKMSMGERLAKSKLEAAPKESPFFNKNF